MLESGFIAQFDPVKQNETRIVVVCISSSVRVPQKVRNTDSHSGDDPSQIRKVVFRPRASAWLEVMTVLCLRKKGKVFMS